VNARKRAEMRVRLGSTKMSRLAESSQPIKLVSKEYRERYSLFVDVGETHLPHAATEHVYVKYVGSDRMLQFPLME
jgi:hypothetical protein